MTGHRYFDVNYNWSHTSIPLHLQGTAIHFIEFNHSNIQNQHHPFPTVPQNHTFSPTQKIVFTVVLSHFKNPSPKPPLRIIIKGTTRTVKSSLIKWLQHAFMEDSPTITNPTLLLAPIGVATFNINNLTIHSTLHIPIQSMHPLEGKSLLHLQEQLQHVE